MDDPEKGFTTDPKDEISGKTILGGFLFIVGVLAAAYFGYQILEAKPEPLRTEIAMGNGYGVFFSGLLASLGIGLLLKPATIKHAAENVVDMQIAVQEEQKRKGFSPNPPPSPQINGADEHQVWVQTLDQKLKAMTPAQRVAVKSSIDKLI